MTKLRAVFLLAGGFSLPIIILGSGAYGAGLSVVPAAAVAPAVTVSPSLSSITEAQALTVTVNVSGGTGKKTPSGSVKLKSGSYSSAAIPLAEGSAKIHLAAGSLAAGDDTLTAAFTPNAASSAIYKSASGKRAITVTKITPKVKVAVSLSSITALQALTVTVGVSGAGSVMAPAGEVELRSGAYRSGKASIEKGIAKIEVPAGSLAAGKDTLTATYTPSERSTPLYKGESGAASITVTRIVPKVNVSLSSTSISTAQALSVTVAVSAGSGKPTPAGTVRLSSGSYTSAAKYLASGSATIDVLPGSLAAGSDTVTAAYTPGPASSSTFGAATGTSPEVAVVQGNWVTVNQSGSGPAVTDQLLGMNMAAWFDPTNPAIVPAFATAGIKAVRWPGGSWSDDYHWATNALCGGTPDSNAEYSKFVDSLAIPAAVDVALTADYGTDAACTGPGEPSEAAAWVAASLKDGVTVSHMTVGNEEYGGWETDMHSSQHDPTTYAAAVTGTGGYYAAIKAASPDTLVGVDVNPGDNWDPTVLANAKGSYDFVEYHFYPQGPGEESDTFLVQQAAQELTETIDTIKSELATAGEPDTPIYVGEMGSVYTDPGKQSTSITQALFAGQVLGEMMNDGVSRSTWWIGFGGCSDSTSGNFSSSLYGWQNFGGYMVFSDGTPEYGCESATAVPAGTLLPTARAYQLFSKVAVDGENVLAATVTGDTTDVRAYAATNHGGTALVLFNLNETASESVAVALSGQQASSGVTVETYSKAIYDQSKTNVWAPPATVDLGAQSLPLALTLAPWSMNVVIVK
jgi:hypothetical protein